MIEIFSNSLGEEELKAIRRVFQSRWIGFSDESRLFEKEFGEKIGENKVLAVSSCTAALFMTMRILDIGPGDEVIVPTINFIGVPNAVVHAGAKPVFADVDKKYLNILPSEIDRLRNKNTKAVFLLHYGGHPCDMDEVRKHCDALFILEDSANSVMSRYKARNCGTLGDIGCFSFDAMKILSMGDGGAIAVKDERLFSRAMEVRYLGIKNRQSGIDALKEKKKRWWEIELASAENRYLTNDILCAIGRVQLRKLGSFIKRRKEVWLTYQKAFRDLRLIETPPEPLAETESSYYLYWVKVKNNLRDRLAAYLVKNDIYCTFRYYPLHLIKQYGSKGKLQNAEELDREALNLPLHQNLSDKDVEKIVRVVRSFFKRV
jgi:aminotransferase